MTTTMDETVGPEVFGQRRWHFDWIVPAFTRPAQMFATISHSDRGLALTPLVTLALIAAIFTLIAGSIREASLADPGTVQPAFEYFTPEQQAQLQQALASTSGPVFIYVLPTLLALAGVLAGWIVVGGMLHLLLTLMGGRRSSRQTLNVVAWASLPFALRYLVRIGAMLSTDQLIAYPGLSGFMVNGNGNTAIYATSLLALIDAYLVWHVFLLAVGLRSAENLSRGKVWLAVLFTTILVLLVRALPAVIAAQFTDLTIIRPFF